MNTTITSWGNSLGIRISKSFAHSLNLKSGSNIKISLEKDKLVITPTQKRKTLKDLVKEIGTDNRHTLVSWGKKQGKEI